MIRYGIVGVGGFAQTWVRSLKMLEERGIARLEAAVIRNPAKYASQVADLSALGRKVYASLDEMLADGHDTIDVVGVPTGIAFHEPMAVQAMEAGYNVVIEKPVAGTIQEVARIAATERRTGRWCAVGYQHIYTPTIQWMRRKVASGELGALQEARTLISWPRPLSYYERNAWAGQLRSDGRWTLDGPATNATAHFINHMTYLAQAGEGEGFGIDRVRAELYRAKEIPSYDTSCIEIVTAGGARLYHYVSHSTTESIEPESVFFFERATVHWNRPADTYSIHYTDGRKESFTHPEPAFTHAGVFAQVARVVTGDEPAPLCGIAEAGPQVLIINLAFESSRGPIQVAKEHTYTEEAGGSPLLAIHGMVDALRAAMRDGGMFSDQGVPWARATEPQAAVGYAAFPSDGLAEVLKDQA